MSSKNRLTINLPEDEHAGVIAMAEQCHVSAAWIGRQALREFLERYRHQSVLPVTPQVGIAKGDRDSKSEQ